MKKLSLIHISGQSAQLGQGDRLGEAHNPEVAGVHLEQHLGLPRIQGGGVVGRAGLVGGAHLHQPGPAAGQDVGHPEAPADLHQLDVYKRQEDHRQLPQLRRQL